MVVTENQNYTKVYELRIIDRAHSKICLHAFFIVSDFQRYRSSFLKAQSGLFSLDMLQGKIKQFPIGFIICFKKDEQLRSILLLQ